MSRTKPAGGAVPGSAKKKLKMTDHSKENMKVTQPPNAKKPKKQKKSKKAQEAPGQDVIIPPTKKEVIVISDEADDVPQRTSAKSTKKPKRERAKSKPKKPAVGKQPKTDEPSKSDMELNLENVFNEGRAVMVRLDSSKNESKTIVIALVKNELFRRALYNCVMTSPLTNSAWITQSSDANFFTWFILCIFERVGDAETAARGLKAMFNLTDHADVPLLACRTPLKNLSAMAKCIDADDAISPRDEQGKHDNSSNAALEVLVREITEVKRHVGWRGARRVDATNTQETPVKDVEANLTTQDRVAVKPAVAESLPEPVLPVAEPIEPTATVSAPGPNGIRSGTITKRTKQPPAPGLEVTHITENKENVVVMDSSSLSNLSYTELVAYQIRYLGEVEPSIPVHGCILCGQNDHLWEICPRRRCDNCGESDKHVARGCPKVKRCSKCLEQGHTMDSCPSKLARTLEDGIICDRCGDDTHSVDECSLIWRHRIPDDLVIRKAPVLHVSCYNCAARDHWGGDCPRPREKPRRAHYDIFSAREATKYLDPSANISNLLSESLSSCERTTEAASIASANGPGKGQNKYRPTGRPEQQPREQSFSFNAPATITSFVSPQVNLSLPLRPPASVAHMSRRRSCALWDTRQQPVPYGQTVQDVYAHGLHAPNSQLSDKHVQSAYAHLHYVQDQPLTLPVRPITNRGNDGYLTYQSNYTQTGARPRSRSPRGQGANYRQRDDYHDSYTHHGSSYVDSRGALHYNGGNARNYGPPPPPPSENEYGRRQTFHAVPPPPPPEPNYGRR